MPFVFDSEEGLFSRPPEFDGAGARLEKEAIL